jgi:predicted HTH domain antitoxin
MKGAYNMQIDILKPIVESLPLFRNIEDKEKFLIVVSALKLRLLSFAKASEIMNMTKTGLLELLEALDIDYSYLSENDVEVEKSWPDDSRF